MGRLLLIAVPVLPAAGCSKSSPLPNSAEDALQRGTNFRLISLEPEPREDELAKAEKTWHHNNEWIVLGETAITKSANRSKIVTAIKAAVRESDGSAASCFLPRHAISVVHNGKTHEFEICFKCLQMSWKIEVKRQDTILIDEHQKVAFDAVLEEPGAKLARPGN